jgi:predicted peroxiredoxin
MRQAIKFGARFFACSDALEAHGIDKATLIPEVSGFAGAAAFLGRVLDREWATLCY